MESTCGMTSFRWVGSKKKIVDSNKAVGVHRTCIEECRFRLVSLSCSPWKKKLIVSNACKRSEDLCRELNARESGNTYASFDENWILKKKAEEVASHLNGRCIFLVGMMGSGKTTVGKVLADALGYSFVDSDNYVEQALGKTSVAQIFKQRGESFFRDNESEALGKLSMIPQLVVATGGGAVVRPINWKYMRQGVSVYLDAPLDALARRIASVGTGSRPLLHFESGDAYTTAFIGLFTLSKKRAEGYSNADATVSLQYIASKARLEDVLDITPTTIANEVLEQIEKHLKGKSGKCFQMLP